MIYYSGSTHGFYDSSFHDVGARPIDAVEITHEQWLALLAGQSAGQRIMPDAAGRPTLGALPDPQQQAAQQMVGQARTLLTATDVTALRYLERGGMPEPLREYREGLRQVIRGAAVELPEAPALPSLKPTVA